MHLDSAETGHAIEVGAGGRGIRRRDLGSHAADRPQAQRGDIAVGDDPPVREHGDLVCGLLDLAEHVRTQQHGLPGTLRLADHLQELPLHQRIEAAGGLVEDEQLGPVHERLDQPDLLLVALRQGAHGSRQVDPESVGQLAAGAESRGCIAGSGYLGVERQHPLSARSPFEVQLARNVADAPSQRGAAVAGVFTEHAHRAG